MNQNRKCDVREEVNLLEHLKNVKEKLLPGNGILLGAEDNEQEKLSRVQRLFGLEEVKSTNLSKHINIALSFTDYSQTERLTKPILQGQDDIICGFCGAKNDSTSIIRNIQGMGLELHELDETLRYYRTHEKVVERINKKQIDEYKAVRELEVLRQTTTRKKLSLRDLLQDQVRVDCQKCSRAMGTLHYVIKLVNISFSEVEWAELDALPRPPSDILARVCRDLDTNPAGFEEWLGCAWVDGLKSEIQRSKNKLKELQLPPNFEYKFSKQLTELETEAEILRRERREAWHNALDRVAREEVANALGG